MGIVALRGIKVKGRVGVTHEERKIGRHYTVDVEVYISVKDASQSDRVEDTLNYEWIARGVQEGMSKEFHLLEAAARHIGGLILGRHAHIQKMKVRIAKLRPFIAGDVAEALVEWDYPEDW